MNANKFEIHLIAECRRTCNCTESPFLNTSVFANVPKQWKTIFMRFNLHANLSVCFKFTFSRIFRKVKKYSIISILLNKPFSFALYMLCIIWVHVKRSWFNYVCIAISCDSLETRRTSRKNHCAWKQMNIPFTPRCIFYLFIRLIWSSDDQW